MIDDKAEYIDAITMTATFGREEERASPAVEALIPGELVLGIKGIPTPTVMMQGSQNRKRLHGRGEKLIGAVHRKDRHDLRAKSPPNRTVAA